MCDRQAGVQDTSEVIKAGVDALYECDLEFDMPTDIVSHVWAAMKKAEHQSL